MEELPVAKNASHPKLKIDYFPEKSLPVGPGTSNAIKRHLDSLISKILRDLNEFSLKANLKEKSLCQLYNLIVCAESSIKPHCSQILKDVVYKNILDEEATIAQRTYKIAELLGLYVQTDFLLPMMIEHLTDSESRNVPHFVSSGLTAFSAVIHHSTQRYPD
jgi:hypothetical protein